MTEQDRILQQQCLRGNPEAQKALYERFKVDMFRLCLRYAHGREEAEDMLQDGFITVFRDLEKFRGEGPLGGWIRMVVLRTALQYLRKRKLSFTSLDNGVPENAAGTFTAWPDHLDAERLTRLVQEMPAGYRTVFNLFAIEGYSHEEIGQLLGIQESTSKTQLFKARAWLQQRLPASLVKNQPL